jgi:hypothetical protein
VTARFHTIGACLALAAIALASPLAHWGHTHDAQGHCVASAARSCDHAHQHAHGHSHAAPADGGENGSPGSDEERHSGSDHECPICQSLAMPALAAAYGAPQFSSELVGARPLATPFFVVQTIGLAFYQRGPPAA